MKDKQNEKYHDNVVSFIPNGEYYFQKAVQALDRNQMDDAYKFIKRAAELSPQNPQILLQYGILEMEAQNFDEAYTLVHTAYRMNPEDETVVYMMAETSGCIGLMADARKYAEQYLEMAPDGMYVQDVYDMLEFIDEEDVEVELEPLDESSREQLEIQNRSKRYMRDGNFHQAIELLEEAIEKYPNYWTAYNNLALAYFYTGDAEQAKALLNEILRENHGNLHALCNSAVIAYYEKNEEELVGAINLLKKITPYEFEHRYKLGATLALIGEFETSYKWLHSMKKLGYQGDVGYYFWLAQSAYFIGKDHEAESAWKSLVELDPSKKGEEPWAKSTATNSLANMRDFIINKLSSTLEEDHLFGLYLLRTSPYHQEIFAHPSWVDVSKYSTLVQYALAYSLEQPLNKKNPVQYKLDQMMESAEIISAHTAGDPQREAQLLNIWFSLAKIAYYENYAFKNANALAAAVEYSFSNAMGESVTKKTLAEKYEISPSTLTKYIEEFYSFIPEHNL